MHKQAGEGQRERERENPKKDPLSAEPTTMRSWPEPISRVGHLTNWATQMHLQIPNLKILFPFIKTKNSYNPAEKKTQATQLKNGQRIWIVISPKKKHKRPTNARHQWTQWPLGKYKLKPQCHVTPVITAIIKERKDNKCWCACGDRGALLRCWWECKSVQPRNSMEDAQRIKNRTATPPSKSTHEGVHKGNENNNLMLTPQCTRLNYL